ncbi:hypothetical protein QBC38DRAFT_522094 [Podospora fimiseda]|uniref:Infection structure specific protein n=1 Tax=Podospora fimiseda TaxID=252190 RepID=A0AAN6YLK4_9PEZI|nr:hypothetical protein QBC38DRAFT_522094 [Podospora fimiseda]
MQSKLLLLTASMAATILANPNLAPRQDTEAPPSTTDPIVIGGAGPGETEITIFPSQSTTTAPATPSTTSTQPETSLNCPAFITSFEARAPQPTGALSSFYNSAITAADVCALVRAPPSSLSSAANAYQTSFEAFFAQPSNIESLGTYVGCLAAEPTATLNKAEEKFLAKATSITKCKSGAAGVKMGMGGVSVVVGLVAGLAAFVMA